VGGDLLQKAEMPENMVLHRLSEENFWRIYRNLFVYNVPKDAVRKKNIILKGVLL
jgi:hypothetical protein